MADHSTVLLVIGTPAQMVFAADSQALTSTNTLASEEAQKLCLWEPSSACAIGGFCEGLIKEGPRKGEGWKLMDSLARLHLDGSADGVTRANQVFNAALESSADYFPNDTDPFELGTVPNGIVILYGETDSLSGSLLMRAEFPITIQKPHERYEWSVGKPSIRRVNPDASVNTAAFVYFHDPERLDLIPGTPSSSLDLSKIDFESLMRQYASESGNNMGGKVRAIKLSPDSAKWIR